MKSYFSKSKRTGALLGAVAIIVAAISPVIASAVTSTANTTINATVASTISMTTSGTVTIALTPTPGGVMTSASDSVLVSTNNTTGYALTLADGDTVASLVSGANNITAHTGTPATPTALGTGTWGYRVDGAATFGAGPTTAETNSSSSTTKFAGMPSSASPFTLKTTAVTAANDPTTVWYGVKADSTKPNGTYTDQVTYTATTNP